MLNAPATGDLRLLDSVSLCILPTFCVANNKSLFFAYNLTQRSVSGLIKSKNPRVLFFRSM